MTRGPPQAGAPPPPCPPPRALLRGSAAARLASLCPAPLPREARAPPQELPLSLPGFSPGLLAPPKALLLCSAVGASGSSSPGLCPQQQGVQAHAHMGAAWVARWAPFPRPPGLSVGTSRRRPLRGGARAPARARDACSFARGSRTRALLAAHYTPVSLLPERTRPRKQQMDWVSDERPGCGLSRKAQRDSGTRVSHPTVNYPGRKSRSSWTRTVYVTSSAVVSPPSWAVRAPP